jgi:multidrug efflux pump
MQPVQDLTVEDRVSRTQFQYTLEDPDATEAGHLHRKMVDKLKLSRSCATWPATSRTRAGRKLVIDRDTAARLGIAMAEVDNTLYDAFGQRQVSTIFTQLNQYHVVLEVGRTSRPIPAP